MSIMFLYRKKFPELMPWIIICYREEDYLQGCHPCAGPQKSVAFFLPYVLHIFILYTYLLFDCDNVGSLSHEAREAFLSALVSEGSIWSRWLFFWVQCKSLPGYIYNLCRLLNNCHSDVTGRAEWLDKGHKKCLILWLRVQDWADIIFRFVC